MRIMLAKCYHCQGKVVAGRTREEYGWGNKYLVIIEDVPCGICQSCGETYCSGEVNHRLDLIAQPIIIKYVDKGGKPSDKPIAVVSYQKSFPIAEKLADSSSPTRTAMN